MNLAKIISEISKKYADKPGIIFENKPFTFGDIDRQVEIYTNALQQIGVKKGDRVAIQLPKCMEFIFLHLAVLSSGAVTLPLNPDYQPDEVLYFLSDSGSSVFFVDSVRFSRCRNMLKQIGRLKTILVGENYPHGPLPLANILKSTMHGYRRTYPTENDDLAVICYTSGTTGRSKGAMITHKNLISNMAALHKVWEWSDQDVLLHVLPLFHVHGLFVALHGALNAGATTIMHEKFDPDRTWNTIDEAKCTIFMGVPTMYQRLLKAWERMEKKPYLRHMRVFISGSAPLLETQFHKFKEETGFSILERYGMTETGMNTSNPIDPAGRKARSVGYPLPGTEILIMGMDGKKAKSGEVGEVWVRGDNVFKGYWQLPEKTQESFQDGWFKTGDLGYMDYEDGGRLYLVGRAKELIITGGYNVYPKEIENVLESHEAVREAAVIGIPDEDFGERVIATVVLNEGISKVSSKDIIGFCKDHLASYKCPKQVFFLDHLPRNAMGKLQKNILEQMYGQKT